MMEDMTVEQLKQLNGLSFTAGPTSNVEMAATLFCVLIHFATENELRRRKEDEQS